MSKATGVPMSNVKVNYRKYDILRKLRVEWSLRPVNMHNIARLERQLADANNEYTHPFSANTRRNKKHKHVQVSKKMYISSFNGTYSK